MIVKRIPAGVYAANCYILIDETTKDCAIIDPGADGSQLVQYIKELKVNPKLILLTHGHIDHTGAVADIIYEFNIAAHIHNADNALIESDEYLFGPLTYKGASLKLLDDVAEGKIFKVGQLEIKVIETPGHTPGGVCYLAQDKVFTGDTLFLCSIGRTDFIGGNFNSLIESIKSKLMILADSLIVYPGHGPSSSIGYERNNNPYI